MPSAVRTNSGGTINYWPMSTCICYSPASNNILFLCPLPNKSLWLVNHHTGSQFDKQSSHRLPGAMHLSDATFDRICMRPAFLKTHVVAAAGRPHASLAALTLKFWLCGSTPGLPRRDLKQCQIYFWVRSHWGFFPIGVNSLYQNWSSITWDHRLQKHLHPTPPPCRPCLSKLQAFFPLTGILTWFTDSPLHPADLAHL